jgi:hypothetical protein
MVTSQVEDSISFRNTFVQCQVPRLVEYTQFNLVFAAGRHRLPQHFVSADWVLGDTSAQLEVWASTSHMCANLLRNTLTKLYKLNLVPKATDWPKLLRVLAQAQVKWVQRVLLAPARCCTTLLLLDLS